MAKIRVRRRNRRKTNWMKWIIITVVAGVFIWQRDKIVAWVKKIKAKKDALPPK